MKKLLSLLLALVMVFSLFACSEADDPDWDRDDEDEEEETEASEYPITCEFEILGTEFILEFEDEEDCTLTVPWMTIDEEMLESMGVEVDDANITMKAVFEGEYKERRGVYSVECDKCVMTMEFEGDDVEEAREGLLEVFEKAEGDMNEAYVDMLNGKEADGEDLGFEIMIFDVELDDEDVTHAIMYEEDGKTISQKCTFHSNGRIKKMIQYYEGEPYYFEEYDKKGNLIDEGSMVDDTDPTNGNEYPTWDEGPAETIAPTVAPPVETMPTTPPTIQPTEPPEPMQPTEPVVEVQTYDVVLWVSDTIMDLTYQQIQNFNDTNTYGIYINATIEGVNESDAGSKVVADAASAPDIYCFPQDQAARLYQAGALSVLDRDVASDVMTRNDAASVSAVLQGGEMWAYPMTSDNGYFMYYDRSIISDEDAESLEAIIAACERNGVKFRYALENAWYTASFFFATGCHSNWTIDQDGNFIALDDTFNSPEGIIAYTGMQKLTNSTCYDSNSDIFTDAGVVISGIWNINAAADHFGDNLGVTDLPSFTVDGQSYHLGSFSGSKLMGVKPQADGDKEYAMHLLAQYLTGEQCQLERYEYYQWGPSNLKAQQSDAVRSNPALSALLKQANYAVAQGQIHGSWWDIAKLLGSAAWSGVDAQQALDDYDAALESVFGMADTMRYAWTVIGSLEGTAWGADFPMHEQADGTWKSDWAICFDLESEFKIRQGLSWDVNYGANGEMNGPNIAPYVEGYYFVVFDPNSGLAWLE